MDIFLFLLLKPWRGYLQCSNNGQISIVHTYAVQTHIALEINQELALIL